MKFYWSLFFFVCFHCVSFCQHVISGRVVDQKNLDISFGDVILRHTTDSSVFKITYIDAGLFTFDPIAIGSYIVEVNCLGYENHRQPVHVEQDEKLSIKLIPSVDHLEAITITESRSLISNKNGNQSIEVANTILASEPTAISVLSLLPKVQVGTDGESISVIGKGNPLIYLGNQRISMQELIGMPVASIKSIELINNPSAKYEADGRAVLKITRKKGYVDGIQVQVHERASWQRNFNNYAGLNASLKKNKIEARANVGFRALQPWEGNAVTYVVDHADLNAASEGVSKTKRPQIIGGCNMYYQINKDDHVSFNASTRQQKDTGANRFFSTINQYGQFDEVETVSQREEERRFSTANLIYNNVLNRSDANLFIGVQYSNYLRAPNSQISNNFNKTEFIDTQIRNQSFEIDRLSSRIDFEKQFKEKLRLEMGVNVAKADAEGKTMFMFFDQQPTIRSTYDYLENNQAAYTQLSGEFKSLDFSVGLRIEKLDLQAGFKNNDSLILDLSNTQLLPRLTLNMPIDSNTSITFNYTTSVNRPHYLNASTISTFVSPFLEFERNANLRATIQKELTLNLGYKNQSLELSYGRRNNPVYYSARYDDATNRIISFPQNFSHETTYAISLLNPTHYKSWRMTNFVRLSMTELQDGAGIKSDVKPQLYAYTRHQVILPHAIIVGLHIWGRTKQHLGVLKANALLVTNFSLTKRIKNKLNITLQFNDIFKTQNFRQQYIFNQVQTNNFYLTDQHGAAISFHYSFGKQFKSNYRNQDVDEELNRMN